MILPHPESKISVIMAGVLGLVKVVTGEPNHERLTRKRKGYIEFVVIV